MIMLLSDIRIRSAFGNGAPLGCVVCITLRCSFSTGLREKAGTVAVPSLFSCHTQLGSNVAIIQNALKLYFEPGLLLRARFRL